jgi:uncharacterized protein YabN with tetrapyrrole methylase and pyrophosphatase domain
VVGTGIRFGVQLTPEARSALLRADHVLYVAAEPLMRQWLCTLRPDAVSLHSLYAAEKERSETYREMVTAILAPVREGNTVCAVFYGHPGVFVAPGHEAIRQARAAGYEATMLPAVSAEDSLFADLAIDPGRTGCQSYEATNFLLTHRPVDTASVLILWQIGVLGEWGPRRTTDRRRLGFLTNRLLELYPREHEVILYEASPYPVANALVDRTPLERLPDAAVTLATTLVVPPRERARVDPRMRARLRRRQG